MILLDTDHLTVLEFPEGPVFGHLTARMATVDHREFAASVVSAEEQMRGWLDQISRARTIHDQVRYYAKLAKLFRSFARWSLVEFDSRAARQFEDLRRHKIRIGTMDLKIAAIALANDALLLSANLRDYNKVPGLRVEDWLRA